MTMDIKTTLFIFAYLLIGFVVDRILTNPKNPEDICLLFINMFIWPAVVFICVIMLIVSFIFAVVEEIVDRIKGGKRDDY